MSNLFAYGSLIAEDIFHRVAGCSCPSSAGILKDFRRLRVKGEEYPGLLPAAGHQVRGIVYHALPETAWERLDSFEGDMYERKPVLIELPDSSSCCEAFTYVVRPDHIHCLEEREWDLEQFINKGKVRFLEKYMGFAVLK